MLPEKLELERQLKQKEKKRNIFLKIYLNIKYKILYFDYVGLLLILFVIACFIVSHEATHGVIFSEYGCKNITYGYEPGAFYTTANCTMLAPTELSNVNMVQALTESIQYPLIFIVAFMVLLFITINKKSS